MCDRSDISHIRDRGEGQYVRSGLVGEWETKLSNAEIAVCQDIAGEELSAYHPGPSLDRHYSQKPVKNLVIWLGINH